MIETITNLAELPMNLQQAIQQVERYGCCFSFVDRYELIAMGLIGFVVTDGRSREFLTESGKAIVAPLHEDNIRQQLAPVNESAVSAEPQIPDPISADMDSFDLAMAMITSAVWHTPRDAAVWEHIKTVEDYVWEKREEMKRLREIEYAAQLVDDCGKVISNALTLYQDANPSKTGVCAEVLKNLSQLRKLLTEDSK